MRSFHVNRLALSEHKIAVVLLAAGSSTRMIGASPKTAFAHARRQINTLSRGCKRPCSGPLCVVVVVRPDLPGLLESLDGLPVVSVPNPRYTEGMGTSLAEGVAALPDDAQAVLVLLGDEPDVSPDIVHRLVGRIC